MRPFIALGLACVLTLPLAAQDDLTLYQPFSGTTTYLVDGAGTIQNSWAGTTTPGLAVYMLPDGDMLRTVRLTGGGGGTGGGFERLSYDGVLEWQFSFFTATLTPHHDVAVLPNGNVLLIAWEEIGGAAAIAAGRDPASVGTSFMPDALYEIEPTGLTTGTVVWEWHAIDHVVQDFDSNLPNFGVVADHPELIDVNYGPQGDWLHTNGIDYNAELDQIAVSVPNFNEIWIIDHSTTTAEAAGHSGGNSGKGGDLLYRWGNPAAYDRGLLADQVFYRIHDVQWIADGRPGAGNLLIFNNGVGRPTGDFSSVDEWVPPVDGAGNYTLNGTAAYGPADLTWTYSDPGVLYSQIMSGAERLENGNTLVCEATAGRIFEVTPAGAIVWTYVNPFNMPNWVFKARRYSDCDTNGVFDGEDIASGAADDLDGNGVLDVCELPINYCQSAPNSAGPGAVMGFDGTTSIAANDLDLLTADAIPDGFGLFYYGPRQTQTAFGDGFRCVGSGGLSTFRLNPPTQADALGDATRQLDFNAPPADAGAGAITAGSTWNFQFWYRDTAAGGAGFNLSDGLSATFRP